MAGNASMFDSVEFKDFYPTFVGMEFDESVAMRISKVSCGGRFIVFIDERHHLFYL